MRIAYIELHPPDGLPLDWLRAVAGCAPNCVGIPDGVPETWGGPVSLALQDEDGEAPEMGAVTGGYLGGVRIAPCAHAAPYADDPAALLGPIAERIEGA